MVIFHSYVSLPEGSQIAAAYPKVSSVLGRSCTLLGQSRLGLLEAAGAGSLDWSVPLNRCVNGF